jgi:hypothetical protein
MVDCQTYATTSPMARQSLVVPYKKFELDEVPLTEYHFCAPTVVAYSLVLKVWGRVGVEQLSEIIWDTNAFEHLVLSKAKKTLVRSLVEADQTNMIKDVVSCKAGGFLVVLHGKPGTGKTLTASVPKFGRSIHLVQTAGL